MTDDAGAPIPPPATPALLLRLAGDQAVGNGSAFLDPDRLAAACRAAGLVPGECLPALRSLEADRLVDLHVAVPPVRWVSLLRLTPAGLGAYLEATGADLDGLRHRVVSVLTGGAVAWQGGDAVDLAGAVAAPSLLVEVVLDRLRGAGLVVFSPAPGRRVRVHRLSPALGELPPPPEIGDGGLDERRPLRS
ncbi:MAG TPA: hypothetical protein VFO65_12555 [Acidimicrobiales bacterium]|nr:hypothetical protein [Acidimicrobiales bacterium]